jgi:glucan 1,3-beta-glucosidase
MSAPDLVNTIRNVKARVAVPVTYADVWEFWLRYREVASAVDFITIHILPYWEDFPIPVEDAAAHVASIRKRVADAFPNREILLGEFGWPSAGRMREGALPSPANQARVLAEVLAQARRDNYRVNIIEAFDQPWKRQLEGTVGGHWGLFGAYDRAAKFSWGAAVSNHPAWRWQAAGGVALAAAVFVVALAASRRSAAPLTAGGWLAVALIAFVCGTLAGWTLENVPRESLTYGDWLRSLAWAAVAVLAPVVGAAAVATATSTPPFAAVLGRRTPKPAPLGRWLAMLQIALAVLAVQAALGLDFDPRYRDFPFASLTGSVFPFLTLALLRRLDPHAERKGVRPAAEAAMAAVLALSALYIVLNETVANWQALWFCAGLGALVLTLGLARDAPS